LIAIAITRINKHAKNDKYTLIIKKLTVQNH